MLTSGTNKKPLQNLLGIAATALSVLGLSFSSIAFAQTNTTTPTTINISDTPKQTNVKRLGVNLGTQNFWDSGMMMRNLAFRNPGFEAETWQSILHCKTVTSTSCTDDNTYTYWPANFLKGATASFIVGPAAGTTATVTSSTAATIGVLGTTVQFSGLSVAPSAGDYLVVRMDVPGNPLAGWWTQSYGGAAFALDTNDLSPKTPGKQALAINASGSGQHAVLNNYDDGTAGKVFLQLSGNYTLSFRGKGTGGSNVVNLSLVRNASNGGVKFWNQTVTLTNAWQDYSFTFPVTKDVNSPGTVAVAFDLAGSSMLIDDVAFTEAAGPDNPTAYRNAVVAALQTLHPGTIRYMDGGLNWGSSFDNLLAPDFARTRSGYNNTNTEADDIAMGLHDFLVLCQTIGADPWFTMSPGMTEQEMSNMMDYFGGSTSTVYGAKRAALGQSEPWTSVFGQIHLEFGNEVWNTANPGATMTDPAAYGKRAGVIFGVAKASPSYSAKSFDFILDGFEAVAYWTQTALANSANYDTVDAASYNFGNYNDASSSEATFGSMLAEPEYMNSTAAGLTNQQAAAAASAGTKPAKLAIYETNIGTNVGAATQAQVQNAIPSLAAGLAVGANMLLAQRDLGVTVQNMFALEGYTAPFAPSSSNLKGVATTSPIWGVTIDMGGPTNLRRPMFLSEALANMAVLPTLLSTTQAGSNPTWNQAYTTNDNFSLPGAHYIQSFAYTDGTTLKLALFNLSRTSALPVNFAGLNAPIGTATMSTLTASAIDANNESSEDVAIATTSQSLKAGGTLMLPAFSMTVLSLPAPVVPIQVYAVSGTCANASLSTNGITSCTATVTGQGKYNTGVTWSAAFGSISSTGAYTAPAAYPAKGNDVITATSIGDITKTGSFTIAIAPNTITGVTPSCSATTIGQGKSLSCTAKVTGTGGFSTGYTWSTSGGSITPSGSLTAPATGTSVTVTATSTQDTTKSGKVTIALTPVLVMGPITASVTGTTATVGWTINMAANSAIAYGTSPSMNLSTPYNPSTTLTPNLTLSGLKPSTTYYLQPYSFAGAQVVSQFYTLTTTNGSAAVSGVAVSCSAASLLLGASTGCAATVSGSGSYSSAVTWKTSLGTISSTGVVTAPLTLLGSTITVTATSVQDTTKSGTFAIALNPPSTVTAVTLACQSTSISDGGTTTCTPTVTGTGKISTAVTFSTSAGSITSTGVLTAPKSGASVTVTATSTQDPTKTASAVISLTSLPSVTGVTVACQSNSLAMSGTTSCAATVAGTGSYTSAVTWSASAGSITSTGAFTAPATGTSVTIKAVSTQDPTKSGSATISLIANLVITNPVTVAGTNSITVSWTVNSSQAHSGVSYGPPGNVTSITNYDPNATATPSYTVGGFQPGEVIVLRLFSFMNGQTASVQVSATTKAAAPTITSVAASCAATSLLAGKSQPCTSSVGGTGTYSSAVTWSTSAGTITSGGLLTAPATGTSVLVKATSVQDPTKYATTTVSITPSATVSSVTVACPASSVAAGGTTSCTASVTGTGSYASTVTWSASGGSITAAGLLTTPKTGTSVTVKATSTQDATKSASATITLTSTVSSVAISCPAATMNPGATATCSAAVNGTGSYSSAVTWSASSGTITSAGFVTAATTATSMTLTATSVQDPTQFGTSTIAIAQNLAILNPVFSATPTTIVLSWTVTQAAHSGVDYNNGPGTGWSTTPYIKDTTTTPSFTFTGLTPGTTYSGVIFSFNDSGTVTQNVTVTTPLQ